MSEWIALNLPYSEVPLDGSEEDSFVSRGLNKPGTLIDVKDHGIFLIGHVNENTGQCSCCAAFNDDHIIIRYKVVWSADD